MIAEMSSTNLEQQVSLYYNTLDGFLV